MSRHRNVRTMNYDDDYEGYNDVYGHSLDDEYGVSPSASQYLYDRSKPTQLAHFVSREGDIEEEPEDAEVANIDKNLEKARKRLDSLTIESAVARLGADEEIRLKHCLDSIRDVVGESVSENIITAHILQAKFNAENALDNILTGTKLDPSAILPQDLWKKPKNEPPLSEPIKDAQKLKLNVTEPSVSLLKKPHHGGNLAVVDILSSNQGTVLSSNNIIVNSLDTLKISSEDSGKQENMKRAKNPLFSQEIIIPGTRKDDNNITKLNSILLESTNQNSNNGPVTMKNPLFQNTTAGIPITMKSSILGTSPVALGLGKRNPLFTKSPIFPTGFGIKNVAAGGIELNPLLAIKPILPPTNPLFAARPILPSTKIHTSESNKVTINLSDQKPNNCKEKILTPSNNCDHHQKSMTKVNSKFKQYAQDMMIDTLDPKLVCDTPSLIGQRMARTAAANPKHFLPQTEPPFVKTWSLFLKEFSGKVFKFDTPSPDKLVGIGTLGVDKSKTPLAIETIETKEFPKTEKKNNNISSATRKKDNSTSSGGKKKDPPAAVKRNIKSKSKAKSKNRT